MLNVRLFIIMRVEVPRLDVTLKGAFATQTGQKQPCFFWAWQPDECGMGSGR